MKAGVEKIVTSGVFTLDGGSWEVDNNVWIVGDDSEVVVIDAAHDAIAIAKVVGGRRLKAIICTHAHNDHINAAVDLAGRYNAPIYGHPDDAPLWKMTYPDRAPDRMMSDGEVLEISDATLRVIHTPGHAPGSVCLYSQELATVFTGDTLFHGGPGATGRSFSDYDTIIYSIQHRLLTLPSITTVRTGHGENTTIGEEAMGLA